MSKGCKGGCDGAQFEGASAAYKKILWVVVAINFSMFIVEAVAGFLADSAALKADSLDFLGDAATYGVTLLFIGRSLKARARIALLKGFSLGLMAVFVLGFAAYRIVFTGSPEGLTIGAIGLLALLANSVSVLLLLRYKEGDANVRSVWLCSRNDAIGNITVMLAGLGVFASGSAWPDVLVAVLLSGLFLHSAISIMRQALKELRMA